MRAFIHAAHQAVKDLCPVELGPKDWSPTPNPKLGDIAIPCFKLAKELKKSPAQVACELADQLTDKIETSSHFDNVSAAGPYLNFSLNPQKLFSEYAQRIASDLPHFGGSDCGRGKTVIVEFSSPNVAKEIALHHLRSTAIGNALANIAKVHNYYVHKINYLGDWGTTHGKYVAAVRNNMVSVDSLKQGGLATMMKTYVDFCEAEKNNPQLSEQARQCFKELEQGDPAALDIWTVIRDTSIQELKKLYQRLNVDFDFYDGESFYSSQMDAVVDDVHNNIGTEISDGAQICHLPGHKIPVLLKKDDGASLYITRDIAAAQDRYTRFAFDEMWYVVANQQKLHFKQLFDLMKAMHKPFADNLRHVAFGMLSFNKQTMKSRSGHVILLREVLDQGFEKAHSLIGAKNPDLKNKDTVAEQIGVGSLLFFDLFHHRNHDINFDWDAALSFEGDTAPFIQYTHARLTSLLQRSHQRLSELSPSTESNSEDILNHPACKELFKSWAYFEIHLEKALSDHDPSQVAQATLKIAKAMNHVYHQIKFLKVDDPQQLQSLIDLTELTQKTLAHGLGILGIQAPAEM